MSDTVVVQYLGFEAKPLVREYTFQVRYAMNERHEFTLTIANEAFDSHRVRYQDAPDVCSLKLQRGVLSWMSGALVFLRTGIARASKQLDRACKNSQPENPVCFGRLGSSDSRYR